MLELIRKYEAKLKEQELCSGDGPIIGGIDADLVWNRDDRRAPLLEKIVAGLNISAIQFAKPSEPYFSMINHLIERLPRGEDALCPEDNENRTFLHDLPVVRAFDADEIIAALKRRKCAIVAGEGIVTYGTISPEQAFIVYSSVLFSLFVKTFVDHAQEARREKQDPKLAALVEQGRLYYGAILKDVGNYPPMMRGPFGDSEDAIRAICEAGRLTVQKRMVDSFFGNISYRLGDVIYISQTTTTLDELEGHIDPCPMDDSACTGITASSEYKAHKGVYEISSAKAIIHGHPKFSVIISMLCDKRDTCENRDVCHIKCKEERFVDDVPIRPGESGTGPVAIGTTLPKALAEARAAIIYGHGIFTRGENDFRDAFKNLLEIEKLCFERYFSL